MTPDAKGNASESPEMGEMWLPVAAAAVAAGISAKTLRRRMAAGAVKSRRVVLARGGAAYEVEMDSVLDSSKPKFQTGVQTDRKKFQTGSRNGHRFGSDLSVKSIGLDTEMEVEMDSSKPMSISTPESSKPVSKPMSISSERETELKDEIRFLRGIVESDRRDMAELRAALRKALDNAPRQLMAGTPEPKSAPQADLRAEVARDEERHAARPNSPQKAPESAKTGISYGDIADWLESELTND